MKKTREDRIETCREQINLLKDSAWYEVERLSNALGWAERGIESDLLELEMDLGLTPEVTIN